DIGVLSHGVLQVAAVVFDFVGDAVDDDAVLRRLAHAGAAELDEFSGNAVFLAKLIDAREEGRRGTVFTFAKQFHFVHGDLRSRISFSVRLSIRASGAAGNATINDLGALGVN